MWVPPAPSAATVPNDKVPSLTGRGGSGPQTSVLSRQAASSPQRGTWSSLRCHTRSEPVMLTCSPRLMYPRPSCSCLTTIGQIRAKLVHVWPKLARVWPSRRASTEIDRCRPNDAELPPNLAQTGRLGPYLAAVFPKLAGVAGFRQMSVNFGGNWSDVSHCSSDLVKCWSMLAEPWPNAAYVGESACHALRKSGQIWHKLLRIEQMMVRFGWPSSAPNSSRIGKAWGDWLWGCERRGSNM